MSTFKNRLRFALKISSLHFIGSAVVASLLAAVVFFMWYPGYLRGVVGGLKLYTIVVVVDVVCGPVLTLILASPTKKLSYVITDVIFVAIIQLSALFYGLHMVFEVRPVAVVFEVDRFVAVSAADVMRDKLSEAPEGYRSLPLTKQYLLSSREHHGGDELFESLDLSLAGFEPSARPNWWLVYDDEQRAKVRKKATKFDEFYDKVSADKKRILDKISKRKQTDNAMVIPLVSSTRKDWIAILDEDMNIIASAPVDGFI